MRLMKMFGLAAVAAVVAVAFVGAASASATLTQLCNAHVASTCSLPATSVSMTNEGVGTLLTEVVDILCLTISGSGTPLAAGSPQQIHITSLSFTGCGTKSAHNNCTVSVLEMPLANLLKTGLDEGTLTGTSGLTLVECENIDIFGIDIHCVYEIAGLQFSAGGQHLTANETAINIVEGEFICPEESFLDALLETENRFVLAPGDETALCKTHTAEACPKGDPVTEVHLLAKNPGWTFGLSDEVKCEESLLKGPVGALTRPQVITVNELTWKNCKLNGKDACTVTNADKDAWRIGWEKLNIGLVDPGSLVKVECGATIDCEVKGTAWKAEGATGTHKGKIFVLLNASFHKGKTCPLPITWAASYESVTDKFYVLK